jgi:hypothetical protein
VNFNPKHNRTVLESRLLQESDRLLANCYTEIGGLNWGKAMTIENFVIQNALSEQPIQETTLESLRAARTLQKMRRSHGVNRVDLIVDNTEGGWLEQWGGEGAVGLKAGNTGINPLNELTMAAVIP